MMIGTVAINRRAVPHGPVVKVIVVDNASQDGASLEYLRSVDWIRLIERTGKLGSGSDAHRQAVELGFEAARAPYVLTIHTDTIPVRPDWLEYHLAPMLADETLAAVGTDKLVMRSPFQEWLRGMEDLVTWWKRFRRTRTQNRQPYIRSHCALYRRSVLEQHQIKYNDDPTLTAGQGIQRALERQGSRSVLHHQSREPRPLGFGRQSSKDLGQGG